MYWWCSLKRKKIIFNGHLFSSSHFWLGRWSIGDLSIVGYPPLCFNNGITAKNSTDAVAGKAFPVEFLPHPTVKTSGKQVSGQPEAVPLRIPLCSFFPPTHVRLWLVTQPAPWVRQLFPVKEQKIQCLVLWKRVCVCVCLCVYKSESERLLNAPLWSMAGLPRLRTCRLTNSHPLILFFSSGPSWGSPRVRFGSRGALWREDLLRRKPFRRQGDWEGKLSVEKVSMAI